MLQGSVPRNFNHVLMEGVKLEISVKVWRFKLFFGTGWKQFFGRKTGSSTSMFETNLGQTILGGEDCNVTN